MIRNLKMHNQHAGLSVKNRLIKNLHVHTAAVTSQSNRRRQKNSTRRPKTALVRKKIPKSSKINFFPQETAKVAMATEISEIITPDAALRIPEIFIKKNVENKNEKRKSEVVMKNLNRSSVNYVKEVAKKASLASITVAKKESLQETSDSKYEILKPSSLAIDDLNIKSHPTPLLRHHRSVMTAPNSIKRSSFFNNQYKLKPNDKVQQKVITKNYNFAPAQLRNYHPNTSHGQRNKETLNTTKYNFMYKINNNSQKTKELNSIQQFKSSRVFATNQNSINRTLKLSYTKVL